MRYIISCSLFLIGISCLYSQIEPALLEVHYVHTMQQDTLRKNKIETDSMVLRIGNNVSQFFSYHTFFYDSLWNDTEGRKKAEELTLNAFRTRQYAQKPGARTTYDYIYTNYPHHKITTTSNRMIAGFSFEEDLQQQQWTKIDSSKQILGYKCKLAICNFRGREWFAWYTESIPFSNGPWKLNGLPGLILQAYNINNEYSYIATTLKEKDIKPVTFYNFHKKEFIPTNRKTFLMAQYKYLSGISSDNNDLIKDVYWGGKKINYIQRAPRKLLYDFKELDYK